jgi:predicted DNA-binding ribbon-helix-helix protein
MTGKRVQFDEGTWQVLVLLARDRMMDFQELADEAFRDLLSKHHRPADLKSALRQSAGQDAAIHKQRATIHNLAAKRNARKRRVPTD